MMTKSNLAGLIDHTLLKAQVTQEEIKKLCQEADQYGFATVCVNPVWVSYCDRLLKKSPVRVSTVIGFPLGANMTETKVFESRQAIEQAAYECDMVMNIGWLKQGNNEKIIEEIKRCKDVLDFHVLKVIIEAVLLTDDEKRRAVDLCIEAGADFVKTSTGFQHGGATPEDIRLIKTQAAGRVKVKASGGIRSYESLQKMVNAGADRIGTSSSVRIMREFELS